MSSPADRRKGAVELPPSVTAAELQERQFPPVSWAVPGLVPAGLTILAGKPKIGKSWLALDIAIACAEGGFTLGDRKCQKGDVLYAALEDNPRRLKTRLSKVARKATWPEGLHFWTEMKRLEDGGLDQLRQWIDRVRNARLIVMDTFAKVRSPKGRDESSYEGDYRQAGTLKTLADKTGVAIIMVHHVRKMEADDPLDAVSGTTGLTGAVDTVVVLKRDGRGVTLFGRGRDIEELELAVEFQRDICRWRELGDADEVRISAERRAVLETLRNAAEPMTARLVSDVSGRPYPAVRKLLFKMTNDGEVKKVGRGLFEGS